MTRTEVAQLFTRVIRESGMTSAELALAAQCSRETVRRIRRGRTVPSFGLGYALLEACGWRLTMRRRSTDVWIQGRRSDPVRATPDALKLEPDPAA